LLKHFIRKVVVRLTGHDDVITPLLKGAPRPGLALGPHLLGPALHAVVKSVDIPI